MSASDGRSVGSTVSGASARADVPHGPGGRRLRIGLSVNYLPPDAGRKFYPHSWLLYVEQHMAAMLTTRGVLTWMVPPAVVPPMGSGDAPSCAEVVRELDGLVLTGGADVAPSTYGQDVLDPAWVGQPERDAYEVDLVRAALDARVPVLGICRGHQLLNVALGGTLYQDIATQTGSPLEHRSQERYHRNVHDVDLVAGGLLTSIYDCSRGPVISVHHQAVCDLAPGLDVEAVSPLDGLVEAVRLAAPPVATPTWNPVEVDDVPWAVGVQWHPEFETQPDAPEEVLPAGPLLDTFLDAASDAARTRETP